MPKWKAENELPGDKSSQKTLTKLSRKNISPEKFLCIVQSTQSTQHVKCSTCFLGLFCHPWRNIHQMTHQLEASHQLRKRDRKDAENFPFNGLWDAIFTAFGCNLSGDDFHLYYSQFFFWCTTSFCLQLIVLNVCHTFSGNCDGWPYTLRSKSNCYA